MDHMDSTGWVKVEALPGADIETFRSRTNKFLIDHGHPELHRLDDDLEARDLFRKLRDERRSCLKPVSILAQLRAP